MTRYDWSAHSFVIQFADLLARSRGGPHPTVLASLPPVPNDPARSQVAQEHGGAACVANDEGMEGTPRHVALAERDKNAQLL